MVSFIFNLLLPRYFSLLFIIHGVLWQEGHFDLSLYTTPPHTAHFALQTLHLDKILSDLTDPDGWMFVCILRTECKQLRICTWSTSLSHNFNITTLQVYACQIHARILEYQYFKLALVNAVMNLLVPKNEGNFLTTWEPASFSRRALLHGVSK
jgi:hypothetical protein